MKSMHEQLVEDRMKAFVARPLLNPVERVFVVLCVGGGLLLTASVIVVVLCGAAVAVKLMADFLTR